MSESIYEHVNHETDRDTNDKTKSMDFIGLEQFHFYEQLFFNTKSLLVNGKRDGKGHGKLTLGKRIMSNH